MRRTRAPLTEEIGVEALVMFSGLRLLVALDR